MLPELQGIERNNDPTQRVSGHEGRTRACPRNAKVLADFPFSDCELYTTLKPASPQSAAHYQKGLTLATREVFAFLHYCFPRSSRLQSIR